MTPKTRNLLLGLLAAVAAALTAYIQGCTPAQLEHANSAADQAEAAARAGADLSECLRAATAPALPDPRKLSLEEALEVRFAVQACFAAAPAADAGAQ